MNPKNIRSRVLLAASISVCLCLIVLWLNLMKRAEMSPLDMQPDSEERVESSHSPYTRSPQPESGDTETASIPAAVSPEVEATHRMIAAHVPLREPSVADPDSPENMAVLQSMLTQLLAQPTHLVEQAGE